MFENGIEEIQKFTHPLKTIIRYYGSNEVIPGCATMFYVNDQGDALTCKHVAQSLQQAQTHPNYLAFKRAIGAVQAPDSDQLSALEAQHNLSKETVIQLRNFLHGIQGTNLQINCLHHPDLDLSIIKFQNIDQLTITDFPTFAQHDADLKPGKMLCRFGFPFPEYRNYRYDAATDNIEWTTTGKSATPFFPLDGMVSRFLGDGQGNIQGFELSTPGLRGQSGGPVFDTEGRIWGIQSATAHHDMNFDIDMTVQRGANLLKVRDHAFFHTGHCVHITAIKAFLTANNVPFVEA